MSPPGHGGKTPLFSRGDISGFFPRIKYSLRIGTSPPPAKKYNALQKAAYTTVPLLALGALATGFAIYWPVQWSGLTAVFGGYDTARVWHFIFMAALVLFFGGHLLMVVIAGWSNFVSMITGWKKTPGSSRAAEEKPPQESPLKP